MSIRKMVSVDLAIQDAMEDMEMEDDRFRPKFTRWAIDAERKIGSFYSYKRDYVRATRCDENHFEMPCQVVGVIGLMFGAVDECRKVFRNQYNYYDSGLGYAANYFLFGIDGPANCTGAKQWEIQDNKIIFMYPQDAEEITLDCIVYQTDDRGFPLVSETHIDAIAQYIKMMFADGKTLSATATKITRGDRADLKSEWNRKCRNARAMDGEPSASDMGEIVSMVNDHLSGAPGIVWRYRDEFAYMGIRA